MVRYKCPRCAAMLESPSSMAGREERCPICGQVRIVPRASKRNLNFSERFRATQPWGRSVMMRKVDLAVVGLVLFLLSEFACPHALGDVLITKSGAKYEGKVVDQGASYVLTKSSGGKMTFPKNMVLEVIRNDQLRTEFEKLLKTADLTNDSQLAKLAELASQAGMTNERKKLLSDAYVARRTQVEGKAADLKVLAAWARKYGLEEEAEASLAAANDAEFVWRMDAANANPSKLEEVAKWCMDNKMPNKVKKCLESIYASRKDATKTPVDRWALAKWCDGWQIEAWRNEQQLASINEAAASSDTDFLDMALQELTDSKYLADVRKTCARKIFEIRMRKDAQNPPKLVNLSLWCKSQGLQQEAGEAEAAALKPDPENVKIREGLGYWREGPRGKWEKVTPIWRAKVLQAVLVEVYEDSKGGVTLQAGSRSALAEVEVEFEPLKCSRKDSREFDAFVGRLAPKVKSTFPEWFNRTTRRFDAATGKQLPRFDPGDEETQFFLSTEVWLTLNDGKRIRPSVTSLPPGYGGTLWVGSGVLRIEKHSFRAGTDKVLCFMRMKDCTVIAVRPKAKITLTFLYVVPKDATKASLRFYRNMPVELNLKKAE